MRYFCLLFALFFSCSSLAGGLQITSQGYRQSGCLIVGVTQTSIVDNTAGTIAGYTKILLDGLVYDAESACDAVNSRVTVPVWANWVRVYGHLSVPQSGGGANKHMSVHLWREVLTAGSVTAAGAPYYGPTGSNPSYVGAGPRPTPEAHYHNRVNYPASAGASYLSMIGISDWIPVMAVGERWTLFATQDTGVAVTTTGGVENWLSVQWK